MARWTEDEFQRVAVTTRITPRTLAACKDVLVHGIPGSVAAERHKMFTSQLSRAMSTLKEKHTEVTAVVAVRDDAERLQQYTAVEVGKALFGRAFESKVAEAGQVYEGQIVAQTAAYLIQRVEGHGVLHDLARFASVPPLNVSLRISYPVQQGTARVERLEKGPRQVGVER
jgi:hypothetical protein